MDLKNPMLNMIDRGLRPYIFNRTQKQVFNALYSAFHVQLDTIPFSPLKAALNPSTKRDMDEGLELTFFNTWPY
jgi:hypothetical protein